MFTKDLLNQWATSYKVRGGLSLRCEVCRSLIPVLAGQTEVGCDLCGSIYRYTPLRGALATPTLTIEVTPAVIKWDVEVTVNIKLGAETRRAGSGEVEVRLLDWGEGPYKTTLYNQTAWTKTDGNGQVRFNSATYDWIEGFDPDWWNAWSSNYFTVEARLTEKPAVAVWKALYLSATAGWSDPPQIDRAMSRWR